MTCWLERFELGPDGIRAAAHPPGRRAAPHRGRLLRGRRAGGGDGGACPTRRCSRRPPRSAASSELQTRWMNGIQFYLRRPVPSAPGHSVYVGSGAGAHLHLAGAVLAGHVPRADRRRPRCVACVSAIISNFEHECPMHGGRPLSHHTRAELHGLHLGDGEGLPRCPTTSSASSDADLLGSSLDRALDGDRATGGCNLEPLLINCPGRPPAPARTRAPSPPNLSIAADYA